MPTRTSKMMKRLEKEAEAAKPKQWTLAPTSDALRLNEIPAFLEGSDVYVQHPRITELEKRIRELEAENATLRMRNAQLNRSLDRAYEKHGDLL